MHTEQISGVPAARLDLRHAEPSQHVAEQPGVAVRRERRSSIVRSPGKAEAHWPDGHELSVAARQGSP